MSKTTLDTLNSNYSLYSYKYSKNKTEFIDNKSSSIAILHQVHELDEVDPSVDFKTIEYINIQFPDKKTLLIQCYNSTNNCVYTTKIEGHLQNGFFKLKSNNKKCHGIPFLHWGCSNSGDQIGLTASRELIIHTYSESSGSLFIFLANSVTRNNYYYFKKKGKPEIYD